VAAETLNSEPAPTAMHLAEIRRYPVKSLRGHSLAEGIAERVGILGDRRWMIVDQSGKFLTQRQHPQLAQIEAFPTENGVELRHARHGALKIPFPEPNAPVETVLVWRDTVPARVATAASDYLSAFLDLPVRLAYLHDVDARAVDPAFSRTDDRVTFADGFPLLVTLTASLDDLNRRLVKPIAMDRFRANLVVHGARAWAEDTWRLIRVGSLTLRIVKACSRCAVPTLDPLTGERPDGNEPLQTLARFRRDAHGEIFFGQNAVPDGPGRLRVGDIVEVLEAGPSNVDLVPRSERPREAGHRVAHEETGHE
jgi:uncharacterized protein YcbX